MNTESQRLLLIIDDLADAEYVAPLNYLSGKVSTHPIDEDFDTYSSAQSVGAQASSPQGGFEFEVQSDVQERHVSKHSLSYIMNDDEAPALPNRRVSIEYEEKFLVNCSLSENISQEANLSRNLQFECIQHKGMVIVSDINAEFSPFAEF